jgi:Rieske 2Fe-2S family protein
LAAEDKHFQTEWESRAAGLGQPIGRVALTAKTCHYLGRGPIRPGFVTQTQDGAPAAPLLGKFSEYDGGLTGITILLFSLVATNDYVAIIRFTPTGPTLTRSEVTWHVRQDAVEGRDYDVERVIWLWRNTFDQDYKICADNQAGINSTRYRPGPYSNVEGMVDTFVQWYLNQIA